MVPSAQQLLETFEAHPFAHAYVTQTLLRAVTGALERLDNGDLNGVRLSLTLALEAYRDVANWAARVKLVNEGGESA